MIHDDGHVENAMNTSSEILIVEDSRTQAMQLRLLLEESGYHVVTAGNGQDGLDLVRVRRPRCVISDIMMPVMDGYTMCAQMKQDDALKDIPVMLLTTLADAEDIIQGLKARADYYLTKPYEDDSLLSALKTLLTARLRKRAVSTARMPPSRPHASVSASAARAVLASRNKRGSRFMT